MGREQPVNVVGYDKFYDFVNRFSLPVLFVIFALSATLFIGFYVHWDRGYLWIDEAGSLWATEHTRSVWAMQAELMRHETNPPLHFWLLYGIRAFIKEPRLAGHLLNFAVVGLSIVSIVGLPWRSGRPRLGILLGIVYLMSASSMSFMQDIRVGFTALSLCAVAVTLSGTIRLKGSADRIDLAFGAGLGLLAGISHVYGALFFGSLATALVVEALVTRNRSQLVFGLALGATCCLTFGAWFISLLIMTGGHLDSIAWLAMAASLGRPLIWRSYFGPHDLRYVMALGFVLALGSGLFRRSLLVFSICALLVVVLPILISIKTPIIFFRYFLFLGPPFHLLLALSVYDLIKSLFGGERPTRFAVFAATGGAVALAVPILTGVANAAFLVPNQDPWWTGIDRVRAEAANCPSHIIRADLSETADLKDGIQWGFTYLLRGTDLKLEDMASRTEDVSDIDCSVVGWAEHMIRSGAGRAPDLPSDDDALTLMHLTNTRHVPLKIERHFFGFVIYKAPADTEANNQ